MIIFGWGGGKVKNHGPALPRTCPSCGHEGFFHYFTITKWLRVYFIPLIPYSTIHFVACPICTAGNELTTTEERRRAHDLVAATAALHSGGLSDDEYVARIRTAFGEQAPARAALPLRFDQGTMPPAPAPASRLGDTWSG